MNQIQKINKSPAPLLEVRGLVKHYGGVVAVDNISFHVDPGEVVVIVGPNGSGKTTTIECISSLRKPTSGRVEIGGRLQTGTVQDRSWFGLQMQDSGLPPSLRAREAVDLVSSMYSDPWPTDVLLRRLGLEDQANVNVENLSGGQRRRLDIALALVGRCPLVILDEPTSGVDPEGRSELWAFLQEVVAETNAGVLLSTHDLNEAEDYSDRIIVIRDGHVVADGSLEELLAALGGRWRMKGIRLSPDQVDRALAAGHAVRTGPDSVTVVGERDAMEQLRSSLIAVESGTPAELMVGPARLEDLFTLQAEGVVS